VPCRIESIVRKSLGQENLADEITTQLGWLCGANDDARLGPKFLNAFNSPTKIDEIEYISQFSGDACVETVRSFYRSTNGMRLFGDILVVPGVRLSSPEFSNFDFFNISLDVSIMSGREYPKCAPENGFLVSSSLRQSGVNSAVIKDILTRNGTIIGGSFDLNSTVLDTFSGFENWITTRIAQARSEYSALKRYHLN
jgi:hypothetical protein